MKIIKFYALVIASLILLGACTRPDYPALENPLAIKSDMLAGTWVVTKVTVTDLEASGISGTPQELITRDITASFPFTSQTITFNVDGSGKPTTFTTNAGNAPVFFLASGNWNLENPVFSSRISLNNTSNPRRTLLGLREVTKNKLSFKFYQFAFGTDVSRSTRDVEQSSNVMYEYELSKQ